MTDATVKAAVKAICDRCKGLSTDEMANAEVKRLIIDELGYDGVTVVTSTSTSISTSLGSMAMRMFMVMMRGPSGEVI